jgi:dTDP-4-dehydrorhamnose 3,5-epimerase
MNVETKKLDIFRDNRGYLISLRANDEFFNGKFGQSLISVVYPGVIKGLHLHKKQTDFSVCIKGNIKYVTVKESEKGNKIESFIIGEKNPLLIRVPPGVWHGYTALDKEATIIHVMDEIFNPINEDVERRDPFYFGDVWRQDG